MFDQQESTPWYGSVAGLIGAAIIIPPLGLALLWMRRNTATWTKIAGTVVIALLGIGYLAGFKYWRASSHEAHYQALEEDRARQKAEAAAQPASSPAANATASAQPAASASPVSPSASPATATEPSTVAAHAT